MRGSQKNKDYKIKWVPEFAYAIGLLTADGNLSKDGRHLEFTSNDIQLVKTFKKCMNLIDVKIGTKTSGFTDRRYPRIQFSNARLYKWLLKIGLMPNKSKTVSKLKIPDKYFFDFLRGYFDGDGSSYSYWDPRWASSFMFYTVFSSGSLCYLGWLKAKLKNLLKIKGHISPSRRAWQLKYAKKESRILFSKMYYKENLSCLKRKYKKLKAHLDTDNKETGRSLKLHERVLELADSLDRGSKGNFSREGSSPSSLTDAGVGASPTVRTVGE